MNIPTNKTILILTANFGAGHVSASKAIKDYILEKDSTCNVIVENFISASLPKMNKPMVKLYENNTKYTPGLYNYYYYFKKSFDSKYDMAYKMYTPKLIDYIFDKNPDLIISTFPLAAACVYKFKLKYPNINIPTLTVITDVVDSLEWIYPNTDMYFVPSGEIKNRFVQKGISPNCIKTTGVPINKDFSMSKSTNKDNKYNILILGGGRGLFDVSDEFLYWLDEYIASYKDMLNITIVTGKNKKLYNQFTVKKPFANINVLGFVTDMPNLIKDFDIMITKPGGATLFEAIHSQIPVIVKVPKVGQEIENARFIIDKGIGFVYVDENDLKDVFYKLTSREFNSQLDFMKTNMINFKKSLDYNNIGDYVLQLINNKI